MRVRGQILALLNFARVAVYALSGREEKFDERISSWRSSRDQSVSQPLDVQSGMEALLHGGHPFAARFSESTANELRSQILNFQPDCIILSRIELSVYIETIKEVFEGRLILDLDESVTSTGPSILKIISHRGQALVYKIFCERVESIEKLVLNKVEQVWVSSKIELNRIRENYKDLNVTPVTFSIIPNSILTQSYFPSGSVERAKHSIIYPASFGYEPSLVAARFLINDLMPLIPEMNLRLVGSHIPAWIRESVQANISVQGPVSDIIPHLHAAGALVVPLKAGSGTRLKVIEALAAGLPVISTSVGVEGLGLVPGKDYLEAETAPEFADRCRELFSDEELANELSSRGLATAQNYFSISSLKIQIEQLVQS